MIQRQARAIDGGQDDGQEAAGGAVGKRTITQGLGGAERVHARIDHARALVGTLREQFVPRLHEAVDAGRDAHIPAHAVRACLHEAERELAEARRMTRDPEDRTEIAEIARAVTTLNAEAEPLLAAAPHPAGHRASGPVLIAHSIDRPAEYEESRATIDTTVQRRADGYPSDDIDLPRTAAAGVAGAGGSLPHLAAIQRSFGGHDVGGVESHVGGRAATAARAIGAEAYATGNQVAFAAEPSLFVAAHEAAHVVQQRAGVQLLGGVGQVGDVYEQQADAVAARVVAGQSAEDLLGAPGGAASTPAVQRWSADEAREDVHDQNANAWNDLREQVDDPTTGDPFAGARRKGAKQPKVGGKKLGQAGFGAKLLGASASAVKDGTEESILAAPVSPVEAPLEAAIGEQGEFVFEIVQPGWDDPWSSKNADPQWLQVEKKYSAGWAGDNMTALERHQFEQWRWCAAYNDWIPLANASRVAASELIECATLMGYNPSNAKSSVKFIEGLELALDMATDVVDAKVLGKKGDRSWSSRIGHSDARSEAKPELGEGSEVEPQVMGAQIAYRDLQDAHNGVYQGLLHDKERIIEADVDGTEGQIAEINAVIAFWTGLAGFVQSAAPHVSNLATGKTGDAIDAEFGGSDRYAYREAKKAGEVAEAMERWDGQFKGVPREELTEHVGNVGNYYDTWGPGGKKAERKARRGEPAPAAPKLELPSISLAGVIEGGLDLMNEEKITTLTARLESLQQGLKAVGLTLEMVTTTAAIQVFQHKAAALRAVIADLKKYGLLERQQDMVQLGSELDSYAVEHSAGLKKAGLADHVPGDDKELYTTMMAVLAKVWQYRATSSLALGAFPYDEFVATVKVLQEERASTEEPPETASRDRRLARGIPPEFPEMTAEELEVYEQIDGTYLNALQTDEKWNIRLSGVVARFETLLRKLEGFDDAEGTVGQRF